LACIVLRGCGARTGLLVPTIERDVEVRDAVDVRDVPGASDDIPIARDTHCSQQITLQVPATTPWTDTGLDITSIVRAMGVVRYGNMASQQQDANGVDFTGQLFFPQSVLPTTVVLALIGKVGGSTAVGSGAPVPTGVPGDGPGFVGATYDQVMVTSGRLFLGYNDLVGAFGDNGGAFTVTVTVAC
jgi:hypothetical protein